ncbi:MAG: UMP kinase [Gammaproteobacteria bacterium]|nr:UMP kinase [Gammaproteobacteria bacterium]MYF38960.1 UMP kinase [Gammaproteobacteria bacterium]
MKYKRITLKLSGEALNSSSQSGVVETTIVRSLVSEIAQLVEAGVQITIVTGGGNIFRGRDLEKVAPELGINPITADHIGMLATVMNAALLRDALEAVDVSSVVYTPHAINGISKGFARHDALHFLANNYVVICAGGTGNPLVTTDTAAALRAIELSSQVVLKASTVDGVYDEDPAVAKTAHRFEALSFDEVLERGLKVMDAIAFTMCKEHNIPIIVYKHDDPQAMSKVVAGESCGTLIENAGDGGTR